MSNLVKSLGYMKCYSSSSPRPVRGPSNSISYNCQKICSRLRRPKIILKIRKKLTLLQVMNNPVTSFSQTLLTTERKLTWLQFIAVDLSPTLNTGTTNETFQQSGKQDSFIHLLKSSASVEESSGSQFFSSLNTEVIKIRVLRKVFSKQFGFIRCQRQHLWVVEQRRYSRFTFVENSIGNLPKVPRAKFLGSVKLYCFISICKFGSLSEVYFRLTALFC